MAPGAAPCGSMLPALHDLSLPAQALPAQPNPRPKRQGSANSFNSYISPLDRAQQHSSDNSSSALSGDSLNSHNAGLSNGSQSMSGYNFYQVHHIVLGSTCSSRLGHGGS